MNLKEAHDWFEDASPLQDPLITARDLRRLARAVSAARSDEARARSLFAEAGYYYRHRNLLLYNGSLWNGQRAIAFTFSWNSHVAAPGDERALDEHHWAHECLAQTLLLCNQVVRKYPHSATAPRAAYLGACSAERLANLNEFWRWKNDREDLIGQAAKLMVFAKRSPNAWLAARARKYAGEFQTQSAEVRTEFRSWRKPTAHYNADQ
jgi:hypothetical protein